MLALHGFGGTPFEMKLVVEVAEELGLAAYAPLLPGHGTHASDLARTAFADWARAGESAFQSLLGDSRRVVVIGLSMGSLIAAQLAATHKTEVCALGMLANATRLHSPFPALALRVVDWLKIRDFSVPKVGADIGDPEARATHPSYGLQPIHGAIEVVRAGQRTEKILGGITVPALIAHGKRDRVCPVANAARVARLLGSTEKRLVILPESHHIITRDYDHEILRRELTDFIARARAKVTGSA